MPKRGKLLSEYERGSIDALRKENKSINYIAQVLGRSFNAIKNYFNRKRPYIRSGGRKQRLSEHEKRRIVREIVKNEGISLRNLTTSLHLTASYRTVHRFLMSEGYKYTKYLKAPFLSNTHKLKRKEWAEDILIKMSQGNLDLKNITFSDEKRFCLDGPDGVRCYWAKPDSVKKFFGKKVFSKGLVIWGGIGYNGTTSLYITQENVNSEIYQNIITTSYLPFHRESYLLMQDNARPHISSATLAFMDENGINLLPWPANSPDCNPIENLWGILVQRIFRNNRQFQSLHSLKQAIGDEWDALTLTEVRNLIDSFPKRLTAVIASKGAEISKY